MNDHHILLFCLCVSLGFALLSRRIERTIITMRMLPIFLSLTGLGLRVSEKLFLGWFGPRGLASVLFALLIVEEYDIAGKEDVLACVVLTVIFSIVLHGVSSAPLAPRIGKG